MDKVCSSSWVKIFMFDDYPIETEGELQKNTFKRGDYKEMSEVLG